MSQRHNPKARRKVRKTLDDLQREHPEWFSGRHFSEPVRKWMPWFKPCDWGVNNVLASQAATKLREDRMRSTDAYLRMIGNGNLGSMR